MERTPQTCHDIKKQSNSPKTACTLSAKVGTLRSGVCKMGLQSNEWGHPKCRCHRRVRRKLRPEADSSKMFGDSFRPICPTPPSTLDRTSPKPPKAHTKNGMFLTGGGGGQREMVSKT